MLIKKKRCNEVTPICRNLSLMYDSIHQICYDFAADIRGSFQHFHFCSNTRGSSHFPILHVPQGLQYVTMSYELCWPATRSTYGRFWDHRNSLFNKRSHWTALKSVMLYIAAKFYSWMSFLMPTCNSKAKPDIFPETSSHQIEFLKTFHKMPNLLYIHHQEILKTFPK